MATDHPLIVVIYDSIYNPVFASQVLAPALHAHKATGRTHVLVSFERSRIAPDNPIYTQWPGPVHIIRNPLPFIGRPTLHLLVPALTQTLSRHPAYEIRARGPHAGWLATHARSSARCTRMTIQVRGLLPAEYAYVHRQESRWVWKMIHRTRERWYTTLEQAAYTPAVSVTFEAVSTALRDYMIKEYRTPAEMITVAREDIPASLGPAERNRLRIALRSKLAIPEHSLVYCYSGSAKPWQCPEIMISYFAQQYRQATEKPYLLLLTQDRDAFTKYIATEQLPIEAVRIHHVPAHDVIPYLAAADIGLLFRDVDLMNWVSRPTKALEYQAAGLQIVHNNTVAWLMDG